MSKESNAILWDTKAPILVVIACEAELDGIFISKKGEKLITLPHISNLGTDMFCHWI